MIEAVGSIGGGNCERFGFSEPWMFRISEHNTPQGAFGLDFAHRLLDPGHAGTLVTTQFFPKQARV